MEKRIIAFSGASGSGKSTLIQNIAKNIGSCEVINDPIRDVLLEFGTNISEARNNITEWCAIQRKVMNIRCANIALCDAPVILLDRAPADIMYYTDIIIENHPGLNHDTRWQRVREEQLSHCDWLAKHIKAVISIEPFKNVGSDVLRDKNRPMSRTYSNRLAEYGGIISHQYQLKHDYDYFVERVNIEGKPFDDIWSSIKNLFI